MKIKEERHHKSRIRFTYSLNSISSREDAMRWVIDTSNQLPFAKKRIDVDDGKNYHDGTISFSCKTIENADSFIDEYLNTEVYSIMVSGDYKGAHITIYIHLDLLRIYIGAEENEVPYIEEIENLLGLV